MVCRFYMVSSTERGTQRFGIGCQWREGEEVKRMRVDDITADKEIIKRLKRKMNKEGVSHVHLRDIIEDCLAEALWDTGP